ncbi:MAG: hypothetical protein ACRDL8_22270 [Solirubrobacteraceae bacterium]
MQQDDPSDGQDGQRESAREDVNVLLGFLRTYRQVKSAAHEATDSPPA